MSGDSLLVYCTHGTYGRDDDAYGALLAANASLAKGMELTLLLVDDGVAMAKRGQDPSGIGLPNNQNDLQDLLDLGGRLVVLGSSLEERGIGPEELIEGAEVVSAEDIVKMILEHDISMTF